MSKDNYFKLLLDPRWQRRKTEIQIRDSFTCQFCGSKENTLNVHHKYYDFNIAIWEYPDEALILLCENCHEQETIFMNQFKESTKELLCAGFRYSELLREINLFKKTVIR